MSTDLTGPRFEKPVVRRDFLGLAAAWSFFGAIGAAIIGSLKLPMPAVFPETDSRFPLGRPEDLPEGGAIPMPRRRLWVFHDEKGLAAISTVCPHLRCIVSRNEDGSFTCPCHGSKFAPDGRVVGGPAPRGLPWFEISLGPDGRLFVDQETEVSPDVRFLS